MSSYKSTISLTEDVLSFRDEAFYHLIEQYCGSIGLEIIQAQDISSVECLLNIDNIFTFLELDSDELIQLKRRAGIILNNGGFVVKKGVVFKFETLLNTLRNLHQRYSTSSHHNFNNIDDLVVPEQLLFEFPFIRTLITYSNIIVKSKHDFTFLNVLLNNMIKNLIVEDRGYRYDPIVRQFAACLYILGGRTAYEFVRLNIPGLLPSVQIILSYIAASENNLTEGLFNFDGMRDHFNFNQSTLGFCAEDATAVVPKITYDTTTNTFIGFSLPLDRNGLPITNSYSTDSFTRLEQWYDEVSKAKSLNACLIQPLSSSTVNSSPFLLAAFGTDNQFQGSHVVSRWHYIFKESKERGIRIIGYSTDCDSRYLYAMRISLGFFADFAYVDHPDLFTINVPTRWSWFYMQTDQLYICFQDPIHICTKLRNRLLSKKTNLLLGNQLINIEPLLYLIDNYSKLDHSLVKSDIDPKDRQNFSSAVKISNDNVLHLLEQIPNSFGIRIYLQAIKSVRLAYIEKTTNIMDRIFHSWISVFIFRFWCLWINKMNKQDLDFRLSQLADVDVTSKKSRKLTKRQYFITYQSHFSIEINAHSLVYLAVLVSEGQLPPEALNIWLENSQTCESIFRSARSISSISSAGVNFTVSQFLSRINKLAVLQSIKDNTNENHLKFPHHHKLSATLRNNSNPSNTYIPSKINIENTVLNAYKFVNELFRPLKINEILRNGQKLSIEELSDAVSRRLEEFWSIDIDSDNKIDIDSDDETDSSSDDDVSDHCDSDEEFDLNGDLDIINNVNLSINPGMRLFNDIKVEHAHTFFRVSINNEEKFLHKQTGCWLLQNDKSSLSADRLSRVQGR